MATWGNDNNNMLKMRLIIIYSLVSTFHLALFGQNLKKDTLLNKNHLSFELGGAGAIGSINYEYLLHAESNTKVLVRDGISHLPLSLKDKPIWGTPLLPFGFYYMIGVKHYLELGINNTIGYTIDDNNWHYYIMPSIGYRFENFTKKSVYFSIAYSPGINFVNKFINWAKIEIGFSF
jgi:hypothetical protein